MKRDRLIELDRLLERILDGEQVDQSTLSDHERRMLKRLVEASGAQLPGLDAACGEHAAFASEIAAAMMAGDIEPGTRIGPFSVGKQIGAGGMGVVFEAQRWEGDFEQRVALKLLGGAVADPVLVMMFQRERAMLAQLEHPNIARLIDGGITEERRPWFAMEYVDGQPVHEYANQHRLSIPDRLKLLLQACDALEHAHRRLILHRDIKPSNLLVDPNGMLRLVDFGLGRIFDPDRDSNNETTIAAGRMTPDYASPEQARGEPVTLGSEVYQLGLVLHVLLTGELPYRLSGRTAFEIAKTISEAKIRPPSELWRESQSDERAAGAFRERSEKLRRAVRGDLDNIVLTALARDPQARYATVAEFAGDLRRHLDRLPVRARAATRRYRLARFVQRNKAAVAGTVSFVGLLLASVIVLGVQSRELAAERDRATSESQRAQNETTKARQVRDYLISLFEQASPLNDDGRDITAYELLQQGAESVDTLNEAPAVQAEMLLALALANYKLLDFEQSAELLDRALDRVQNAPSASDADYVDDYAEILMWRGRVAQQQNDHAMAVDYLTRANTLLESVPDRPVLYATSLRNLGITLANERELERAEALFKQALDIYADKPEFEAERYAILNDLGVFYNYIGQPEKALTMFEDLLAYRTESLGEDDPLTLHTKGNLATIAMGAGRRELAVPIFKQLVDDFTELYGAESQEVSRVKYRLGRLALEDGDYERSGELLAEARRTRRLVRGPDDGNLATIISWQAALADQQGNLELAVTHLRDSLAIYDRIRPEPHPSKLELRISLGETLNKLERREQALAAYIQAFDSLEQVSSALGIDLAMSTAEGLTTLARDSLAAGERETAGEALDYARQAAEFASDEERLTSIREKIIQLQASIDQPTH